MKVHLFFHVFKNQDQPIHIALLWIPSKTFFIDDPYRKPPVYKDCTLCFSLNLAFKETYLSIETTFSGSLWLVFLYSLIVITSLQVVWNTEPVNLWRCAFSLVVHKGVTTFLMTHKFSFEYWYMCKWQHECLRSCNLYVSEQLWTTFYSETCFIHLEGLIFSKFSQSHNFQTPVA